jgi:pimeloyl-ACP methyl ester carboxylesterase
MTPALAAELAALFADSTVTIVDGAGHRPQHDQPRVVADLLLERAGLSVR